MARQRVEKKWNTEKIRSLLETNDTMVGRSLVQLFNRQTADEQRTESTNHRNNMGFNGGDAHMLTRLAKFYMRNGYLSPKQLIVARERIMKYAAQLTKIANGEM